MFRTRKPAGASVTWYRVSGRNRIRITETGGPKYFILEGDEKLVVADVGPEDIGVYMALVKKGSNVITRVYFKATKLDYHRRPTVVKAKEYYTVKLSFNLPRTAVNKLKGISWYHTRPFDQIRYAWNTELLQLDLLFASYFSQLNSVLHGPTVLIIFLNIKCMHNGTQFLISSCHFSVSLKENTPNTKWRIRK